MPDSFGARLRARRERQQVTLTTIADQTKIKLSLLEALERDDVSQWPAGIFRRAFVRAYAHAIGLEPDVVVREFLDLHPDPIEVVEPVPVVAPRVEDGSRVAGPPIRLRYLVGSAIGSLFRLRQGVVGKGRSGVQELAAADCTSVKGPVDSAALKEHIDSTPVKRRVDTVPVKPPVNGAQANAPVDSVPVNAPVDSVPVNAPVDTVPVNALVDSVPVNALVAPEADLLAVAHLCTELGRVDEPCEAAPLLQEAVRILDAVGLIVWVWHPQTTELRPALAQGYSDNVLAQLPTVERDAENATAAAFRSAQTCVVSGNNLVSGALVVPLMTPVECVGVLAIELQHGREHRESVRAFVTIFAAQLARVVGTARRAETADRRLA